MTQEERDAIRSRKDRILAMFPNSILSKEMNELGEIINVLLYTLDVETNRANDFDKALKMVNDNLRKHLFENHACENCPHESGWCKSPNMKSECARAVAAERDRWKARADAFERAIKESPPCRFCKNSVHNRPKCYVGGWDKCNGKRFEFDEARFTNEQPDEPNQQQQ